MPKKFNNVLLIILLLVLLIGCRATKPNDVLIFSLGGDATFLNPILYSDSESASVVGAVFNGLVRINEKLEVIPDLAEKWSVSKDGLIWIFY